MKLWSASASSSPKSKEEHAAPEGAGTNKRRMSFDFLCHEKSSPRGPQEFSNPWVSPSEEDFSVSNSPPGTPSTCDDFPVPMPVGQEATRLDTPLTALTAFRAKFTRFSEYPGEHSKEEKHNLPPLASNYLPVVPACIPSEVIQWPTTLHFPTTPSPGDSDFALVKSHISSWEVPAHDVLSKHLKKSSNQSFKKPESLLQKPTTAGITKPYSIKMVLEDHFKDSQKLEKKEIKKRTWTKMTPELFKMILEWENSQNGAIKQSDVEKKWNVNRTTYYRWKLRNTAQSGASMEELDEEKN